ncbi:ion transporter [Azorhizobium oxalatiphilum]|uniref:Ion transporter n=1 Tax=Azorhizobium oxalatiphilum TaxID=980631 RepID=A0A917C4L3_9HYPH|nr:ion channel [Azorhizobium oxalatiphilum]GGF67844.1 ion transporter [Azorhizobium oxalatiphilum]
MLGLSARPVARLRELYYGDSARSARFRFWHVLLAVAIMFFIAALVIRGSATFLVIDVVVAVVLAFDMIARITSLGSLTAVVRSPLVWLDGLILLTLIFPYYLGNFGFLRALKIWTLVHSDIFWQTIGGGEWDDTYIEDVSKAAATLLTFVFLVTGLVYVVFLGSSGVHGYVDALYFTVTSLTTTGYGDVTLPGTAGRLISIAIMLAGITLSLGWARQW